MNENRGKGNKKFLKVLVVLLVSAPILIGSGFLVTLMVGGGMNKALAVPHKEEIVEAEASEVDDGKSYSWEEVIAEILEIGVDMLSEEDETADDNGLIGMEEADSDTDVREEENDPGLVDGDLSDSDYTEGEPADPGIIEGETVSVEEGASSATVMVYMNGSDLESRGGAASEDIDEMLDSGIGENVNVVIQTMGTREWTEHGIASDRAQTYIIQNNELKLVRDDLGQLDCTSPDTLSDFIGFCKTNYPADRYFCILWDHGGGPVYGFGYDEWRSEEDSLTLDEMAKAFSENSDISFDIIGMDCCIMGNIETCYALAPYCKYSLLSEDFESEMGWSYTKWMKKLENNPGISTPLLGKYIIDSIIEENENSEDGESSCMALYNETAINSLFEAWKTYAYKNQDAILEMNYSKKHSAKGRGHFFDDWLNDESNVTLADYYITDMLALLESVDNESEEAKNLTSLLKACMTYYGHTSDKNELTGLSVSLPYGDDYFYDELRNVYGNLGIDSEYIDWLGNFVSVGYEDYYDYGSFEDEWGGWGDYEEEYGCSDGSCENSWFYSEDGYGSEDHHGGGPGHDGGYGDSGYGDGQDPSGEYEDGGYEDGGYEDDGSYDDWLYDYEDKLWYLYEDGLLYLYDDETDFMFCYDEAEDIFYYYDEEDDEWYETDLDE